VTTALYRRYRPESFAEVIGQEHVTGPLRQALRSGQVNHAYLFSGPRGCGKTSSARILARILNCVENTPEHPTDTPCGVCASCVELARGGPGSLDVVEIDAASHGGVDDARELRERATFAPARDRYKIFILDEAHMVTPQGFNALLKIVEEPPPHVKFVFATTEPDKVIGTIRSRTHHYPFRLVPPDVLIDYLAQVCTAEGVTVGSGVLPLVVRAGAGSVRDALSVLDQLVAGSGPAGIDYEGAVALLGYTHVSLLDDLVGAVTAGDGASAFRVVERVISTGHEPRRFVEDLLERIRDLIVISASGDAAGAVFRELPTDQLAAMRVQAGHLGAAELSRAADLVNDALREMTGATSPRLHLELLVARLLLPSADDGVTGFAARLDRLERGGRSSAVPGGSVPAPHVASGSTDVPPVPGPSALSSAPGAGAGAGGRGAAAVRAALGTPERAAGATVTAPAATVPVTGGATAASTRTSAPTPAPTSTSAQASTSPASEVAWPEIVEPGAVRAATTSVVEPSGARVAAEPDAPMMSSPDVSGADVPAPDVRAAQAPAAETPATPVVPAHSDAGPVGTEPSEPRRDGRAGAETEVLRRRWPEVLETLKQIKRVSWILVSQNAQVADLDATTLRLSFAGAGVATAFRNGPHAAAIQQAVRETLGFDVRVEGVLDEHAGVPAASGRPRSPGTSAPDDEPTRGPAAAVTAASATVPNGSRPGLSDRPQPDAVAPIDAVGPDREEPVPDREEPGPDRDELSPDRDEPALDHGATAPVGRPTGASPSRDEFARARGADEIPDAEDPGDPEWRGLDPDDGPPVAPPTRSAAAMPASSTPPAAASREDPRAASRSTPRVASRPSPRAASQSDPRSASQSSARPAGQPSARPVSGRPMSAREAGELAYARAEAARRAAAAVEDSPSPDDPDLAASGLTGAPLVAQMLGGTVIDEQLGDEV